MKPLIAFWVNNNARVGFSVTLLVGIAASRGLISLQTMSDIGAFLAIWGIGSVTQGAKNGFKPPAQ